MKRTIIVFLYIGIFFSCSVEEKNIELTKKETSTDIKSKKIQDEMNCSYINYLSSESDYIANDLNELRNLISSTSIPDYSTIYLADQGNFDVLTNDPIEITRPLQIVSGRNENSNSGARIYSNVTGIKLFNVTSSNVTLSGLKIIGHDTEVGDLPYSPGVTVGVSITGYNNLKIENCEISGWSYAGIELMNSKENTIKNNYIHHNRRSGLGYGVVIDNSGNIPTNALITCNYFEFNRHDIAGSGNKNQGFEASYNIIGMAGVLSHRFDMHGAFGGTQEIAGSYIKIHHNQFLFDDDFAIRIGGITELGIQIYNNTFKHKCEIKAIEQRKLNIILNRENWIGINTYSNTYSNSNINDINLNNLFLFKNTNNEILKYSFGNECNCNNLSEIVGHGFNDYSKFLVGNWIGDEKDELLALTNSGELHLFPFNNGTFYGQGGGVTVGHGFNGYKELLVGNWVGDGTDDLIAVTNTGEMILYPFNNGTFYGQGGGVTVGHGFNGYKEYLVGNWTGASDGTEDLIALTDSGEMILYPFNNNTFYNQGGGIVVGHGFSSYKKLIIGKWNNDGTDDLMVLSNNNSLVLYSFNNTFYNQGNPHYVGSGFVDYKDFIAIRLPNRINDDLIVIDNSNHLYLYYLNGNSLGNEKYIGCIKEYNLILNGKWQ